MFGSLLRRRLCLARRLVCCFLLPSRELKFRCSSVCLFRGTVGWLKLLLCLLSISFLAELAFFVLLLCRSCRLALGRFQGGLCLFCGVRCRSLRMSLCSSFASIAPCRGRVVRRWGGYRG